MTVYSQNGWPANDRSVITSINIPGGSVTCRQGSVAAIFQHLANRYHNEVQHLVWPGCWGYAEREIRGGGAVSNHASGTAIDLNAPLHPLGTNPSANYTAAQIAKIHEIVSFYEGVVRWGGDYDGRKDGMHFEINDGITFARADQLAAKLGGAPVAPTPAPAPGSDIVWETSRYTGPNGVRILDLGSVGDDVAFVQRWHGIDDDGEYGHDTANHVKETQARNHVEADGVVGPVTWGIMGVGGAAPRPVISAGPFPLPHTDYFGLVSGPSRSHGGYFGWEQIHVKHIQQKLIVLGYVPGISDPNSGWADGVFQQPTADAVARFQHDHMPGTTFFGQVWFDDWAKLFSL